MGITRTVTCFQVGNDIRKWIWVSIYCRCICIR